MKRVAWIIGGARGLGVMVAKGLAEDGYQIALNYHNSKADAEKLQEEIQQGGSEAILCQGDVCNSSHIRRMAKDVIRHYGRIDVLACVVGPFIFKSTGIAEYTDEEWDEMINGNLSSLFYCIKEVVPLMRKQRFGRIITFGFSEVDQIPAWSGYGAYAAAKVGVASLTRTLSKEEAPNGITVNMICPGDIRDPHKESTIQNARQAKERGSLIGRSGSGEDIARVVRFLSHPDSDFITGAIIPVTGGFSNH